MTGRMKEVYESPMIEILTVTVDILTSSNEEEFSTQAVDIDPIF
jgi:hypothetical protein